jgi:PAS domain S-box-containing protein
VTTSGQLSTEVDLSRADRTADGLRSRSAGGRLLESPQLPAVLAAILVVFGLSVLAGWALGLPLLTNWVPGLVQTKVNAALCFVGLGGALGAHQVLPGRRGIWLSRVLAMGVIAIAGATLLEQVTGIDLGIDQIFVADLASAASPHPGRFAVQTAIAFLSAAAAVLLLGRGVRGIYPSELLAVACGVVGGISMLGYLYGAPELLSVGSSTQVSLPASLALIATCGSLVVTEPDHVLVRLTTDAGIAGQVMRRILPAALVVVPLGAWLRLVGERASLYDESVGLSIMVTFEALVLVGVGAWTTGRVGRLEEERLQALADLIRLGAAASTPLIETAPVGLAVLDRDLRYLYVNPALVAIGGVSAVASLGQRIDRIVPAFGEETMSTLARVMADGVAVHDLEVSGPTRQSERSRTWLLSAEVLRDSEREAVGLAISVVEITERKHREEALAAVAELQRQAQAIGESIPYGIWVAQPDGLMRYLSQSFLQMSGQSMEEARDLGWMASLAPEIADQAKRDWAETVATRAPWNHELAVQAQDGYRRTILSRGFPVRDEKGEVTSWAGINLDITDRKDAEEFREAFLGILSHELGTPITSIYGASTLLSRPGLTDARRSELLGDIGHESERLRRLIEDLVVLARAERGTIQVHTEPVLLQRLLPKVRDEEQRRWPNNSFKLTTAPRVPVARADEAFVEQIVRNLLENAAKYGPADGLVELMVDAPDGWPRVRVLDRGPGIDPAEAERLFEVFYRSERTSRVAGSGIGLFVAHRLVESIGGTIWARPREDGSGAEFGFRLQPMTEDVA